MASKRIREGKIAIALSRLCTGVSPSPSSSTALSTVETSSCIRARHPSTSCVIHIGVKAVISHVRRVSSTGHISTLVNILAVLTAPRVAAPSSRVASSIPTIGIVTYEAPAEVLIRRSTVYTLTNKLVGWLSRPYN